MGRRSRSKMEKWMETKTMKLTKETLRRIIKEELNNLMEQDGKVTFMLKYNEVNANEINIKLPDGRVMKAEQFVEEYPGSKDRIKHLGIRFREMHDDAQGRMGSEINIPMRKKRIEDMASSIAKLDLGGAEFEVVYK